MHPIKTNSGFASDKVCRDRLTPTDLGSPEVLFCGEAVNLTTLLPSERPKQNISCSTGPSEQNWGMNSLLRKQLNICEKSSFRELMPEAEH
jgi:hypothetical protein